MEKIPVGVCFYLMQKGNPVRFYHDNPKIFHLDTVEVSLRSRQRYKINHHFNALTALYHIVAKRPESFLLIITDFNVPTK